MLLNLGNYIINHLTKILIMTKDQLKDLVKEHFNLVENNSQEFDSATLEDGSKVTNDMDEKFDVGQKLFIIDEEGNKVDAPEGDHVSESGIVLTVDAEGVIVGMKSPDEEGEGSDAEQLEEEAVEEKMSEEVAEEATEELVEEKLAEEEEIEEMEEMPKLEDIISVIGEVVEEKMGAIKDKMDEIEEEVSMMKDKMSSFASEPAEEKTVPTAKFSAVKNKRNDKRYNAMLQKLNKQ